MRSDGLLRLEEDLRKIPGITHARVVGEEKPREIHIVASPQRSPKQLVRDVQSLAAARFGMPIDHRIVSIVRLDEAEAVPPPPPPPVDLQGSTAPAGVSQATASEPATTTPVAEAQRASRVDTPTGSRTLEAEAAPAGGPVATPGDRDGGAHKAHHNGLRPVLDRVILATKGNAGWVRVALKWPNGRETQGDGSAGASRETRARGACIALIKALQPVLQERGAALEIDHIGIQPIDSGSSVVVKATFYEGGNVTPVLGSAIVQDDVASAAVRALLQATNRKLR